jgi:hypothetical protein
LLHQPYSVFAAREACIHRPRAPRPCSTLSMACCFRYSAPRNRCSIKPMAKATRVPSVVWRHCDSRGLRIDHHQRAGELACA